MTFLYNTHQKTQAQNNIEAHLFDSQSVEIAPKELNYFEKNKLIKFSVLRKFKGQGQCVLAVFDYLTSFANNNTGISYHSQARMEECLGFSKRQIIRALKLIEGAGYIYKCRRGRNVTNAYMINFELINNPNAMHGIKPSVLKSYPRKPRKTWPIPEVTSDVTLTTNTEVFFKEVSINTYEENNTNFCNFNSKVEEEIPIKISEEWQPILQTNKNLKKCLGVTDQFIRDELKGFTKSVMRSSNRFYNKELTPKDWNALFYVHCQQTLDKYNNIPPSRRIPLYRRLEHNDKPKPKPIFFTIANTNIAYEDMRNKSSSDDIYATEEELEDDLAAWYAKHNIKPPTLER